MAKDYPPTGRIIFTFTRENGKTNLEMIAEDVSGRDHAQAMELLMERMTELGIGKGIVISGNPSDIESKLRNVLSDSASVQDKKEFILNLLKSKLKQATESEQCMCPYCVAERKQRIKNDPSIN